MSCLLLNSPDFRASFLQERPRQMNVETASKQNVPEATTSRSISQRLFNGNSGYASPSNKMQLQQRQKISQQNSQRIQTETERVNQRAHLKTGKCRISILVLMYFAKGQLTLSKRPSPLFPFRVLE